MNFLDIYLRINEQMHFHSCIVFFFSNTLLYVSVCASILLAGLDLSSSLSLLSIFRFTLITSINVKFTPLLIEDFCDALDIDIVCIQEGSIHYKREHTKYYMHQYKNIIAGSDASDPFHKTLIFIHNRYTKYTSIITTPYSNRHLTQKEDG
eukprot:135932_1